MQARSIFPVGKHLHATSCTAAQAIKESFCLGTASHFVEIGESTLIAGQAHCLSLAVIYGFCNTMCTTLELEHGRAIIVCPADQSTDAMSHVCQLCGAYLILCEGLDVDQALAALTDILYCCPKAYQVIALDCWAALHRARNLGWLSKSNDSEDEAALDVEMVSHYALACNGSVCVLVPGKLLLFPAPAALPEGQSWTDTAEPDGPTARHFSAAFLAALLADLGASSVACLGKTFGGDAAAFHACGLDVHDLALDPRQPALLPAMDRLLAVARAAPGPTALFPCSGCAERAGAMCVEALAAAWLMTGFGFGSGAAAAWVQIACPGLLAEGLPGPE
jgi:hypothetical protein